jgi:hypothetical protein
VIGYIATALPGGAQAQCSAPCTSIVLDPMTAGSHVFVVTAVNGAGAGESSPLSISVTVYPMDDLFHAGFDQ